MNDLREDVALANRIAEREGLVTAFGHVSARIPGTDTFLLPPRAAPGLATPESLLVLDIEGNLLEGVGVPNTEHWIHARIYSARPEVGAVAHVHAPACVVSSQLGRRVEPLHNTCALSGKTPLYERAGFRPIEKGQVTMPGPVDPARLLVHELVPGAFDGVTGMIKPDWES